MQTPADTPAWAVDTQRETTTSGPGGGIVSGVEVGFHTAAGHAGTLFITDQDYANLATVKALVGAAAAHMDAVGTLGPDTPAGG